MRIFLVGFTGSGKSTYGKEIAKALALSFIDMDDYIAEKNGKKVSELFKENEKAYRETEKKSLHELFALDDYLLATGGCTPCYADNMDQMNEMGITVYLRASESYLFRNLRPMAAYRPLLNAKTDEDLRNFITTNLPQREVFFLRAKHTIDIDNLTIADIIFRCKKIAGK